MNTLSTNSILENLNAWKDYKDNINSVIDKSVSGAGKELLEMVHWYRENMIPVKDVYFLKTAGGE